MREIWEGSAQRWALEPENEQEHVGRWQRMDSPGEDQQLTRHMEEDQTAEEKQARW